MDGRSRLVLAGISAGGGLWEAYIQWRTRMGDKPIDGLILWSNPTSEVWCSHSGGGFDSLTMGDWTDPRTGPVGGTNYVYGSTLAHRSCRERHDQAGHNFGLGEAGQKKVAEMENSISGHEAKGATWIEESFQYQMIGNCPNKTIADTNVDVAGAALPHIHWTEKERAAKRAVPKLILYSHTTSAPECKRDPKLCYSWPRMQDNLRGTCKAASNCKLEFVQVEPWTKGITMEKWFVGPHGSDRDEEHEGEEHELDWFDEPGQANADEGEGEHGDEPHHGEGEHGGHKSGHTGHKSGYATKNTTEYRDLASTVLWGHWVHSANPEGFRERVEAWVERL
jgi:hypothetical protein